MGKHSSGSASRQAPRDIQLRERAPLFTRSIASRLQARAGASAGSDGIRLRPSKQEVQDLPPVDVDHPGASTADGE